MVHTARSLQGAQKDNRTQPTVASCRYASTSLLRADRSAMCCAWRLRDTTIHGMRRGSIT